MDKTVKLTERQLQTLIVTIDEALGALENRKLANEYRQILKRLYAAQSSTASER